MTQPTDSDNKPLDPAQADIVRRLRRLMVFSSLIMLAGFAVVFGVIGYRMSTGASVPSTPPEASVSLPKGARIVSSAVADGKLAITLQIGTATEVRFYDLGTLQPRGRLILQPAP
jgi:hypothetical protein